MADRPTNKTDLIPDEPKVTGGWRKPSDVSGGWRPQQSKPAVEGWRVPAMPADLEVEPETEGTWHLPAPEDTIFSPEDQIEVKPERAEVAEARPEDMLLGLETEGESTPTETMPVAEQQAVETDESTGANAAVSEPAKPTIEDTSELGNLLELEASDDAPLLPEDDDDDEGAFSMSELLALSSLVENQPAPSIVPTSTQDIVPASPAEQALLGGTGAQPAATDDPAEYARKQLELLTGKSPTGAQPAATIEPAGADDPAAYARRQLEQLGAAPSGSGALPSVTLTDSAMMAGLTPEQQELARRFRETENQVRTLRARFQAGQITRDDLQAQLRQLMILDENRVWWMMGVETDTWYKFDNGDWMVATPPYGTQTGAQPAQPGRGAPPTATSGLNASEVIGGSLPYFPSEPVAPVSEYTQPSGAYGTPVPASGFGLEEEEMPLPQKVPIQDPDLTVVSPAGAYLEQVRRSDAETLQGLGRVGTETVVNPAVNLEQYQPIPAPGPTDSGLTTAPDYNVEQAAPTYEEIAEQQRRETVGTILRLALVAVGVVLLAVAAVLGLFLLSYNGIASEYQSQITGLANYRPEFQTSRVLDMNGDPLAELNSQAGGARTSVPLNRISPFMIHAVVSLENERFFEDPGWDWVAIGRAFAQNLGSGAIESGASTITQQIAEQLILKQPTNTADLKLREIIIAAEIAKRYTKQQILELYLNEIFFGNQSYGVEAAAEFYFDHTANDLNLPESALMAGVIASPGQYNPVRTGDDTLTTYNARRDATFQRMDFVINRMQQVGCLTFQEGAQPFCVDANVVRQAAVQKAEVVAATYEPRQARFQHPHFVQFVQAQVERLFPGGEMFRRGFVIRTTLNPSVQDAAESALRQQITALATTGVNTGAVMVTDPRTGAIRAMVGSPDFNNESIDGQVNGALTWQQPGSAIKPVLYTGALEGTDRNGDGVLDYMTPATVIWDVPTTFNTNPPYTPTNFDGQFWGPLGVRYALQNSRNVPAVKAFEFIGSGKFQDVAGRMGLNFLENAQFGLASALGATEVTLYDMMAAYGTLANNGVRTSLFAIESITDANGQPIVLAERTPPAQVVQPSVAFLMQNILSDDNARAQEFGLNGPMTIQGLPASNFVAAKTGTTNQTRDLWTLGFTHNAVVGVWMGRPDNNPTFVQGGGYRNVAPLWNEVMMATLRTIPPPEGFNPPGDGSVIQAQICPDTGTQPTPNCPSLRTEFFLANQPPPPASQAFVQQISIDTWTGLRATELCPDNTVSGTFVNITDPSAIAWLNSPAGRATAQRLGLTEATIESPPSGQCDINTEVPIARIVSPTEGQPISGVVQITGAASASTFNRYQLEVANAGSPNNFSIVSGPTTVPQTSGTLGQWETRNVPNGTYILRLAMFSSTGGYLYRTVTVIVNNVQPTATTPPIQILPTALPPIQILPTSAPLFSATSTPIPFDEVVPPP